MTSSWMNIYTKFFLTEGAVCLPFSILLVLTNLHEKELNHTHQLAVDLHNFTKVISKLFLPYRHNSCTSISDTSPDVFDDVSDTSMSPSTSVLSLELSSEPVDVVEDVESLPLMLGFTSTLQ